MKAIFNREWQSYFLSPIGYIFTGVFIALCSFFFVNGALMYQSADLNVVFSNINIVYLFLVSMLTMGLFSAERSRKTDQLLLTSPVEISHIVMGKYFSAMAVFGTTLILTLIYPIVLNIYGSPSQSEMIGTYIGFILLWGSFIAIGTFISSLMENQIIAAVTTFGALLVVYCLPSLVANISNGFIAGIVEWISITDRYYKFQSGILDIEHIIYYISVIFIFLFLTAQTIKGRQYSDKKIRINNLIVTAATIIAVLIVNSIVSVIGAKLPLQIDLTRDDVYEYSEETKEVLDQLDSEVNIYAIYPDGAEGTYVETVKQYLEAYNRMNSNIKVEYRDPYEDPAFVRSFGDDVEVGALIVKQGDRSRVLQYSQIFNQNQFTGSVSIDAEKLLTSAIRYVSGAGRQVNAYFVKGHGEYAGAESQLAGALEAEGYTVGEILISTDGIPEDASLLISLSPSVDYTAEERDAIDRYLLNGGSMAFAYTAGTPYLERINSYIAEWGININNDFVIENDSKRAFRSQNGVPVPSPVMEEHTITSKISNDDIPIITPAATSLSLGNENLQGAKTISLLKTTEKSYGVHDIESGSLEKGEGDIEGPLTIAAMAEKPADQNGGKLYVIGSLQAIEVAGILTDASYSNGDFIINSMSYLAGKGDAMNIRAKNITASALIMTEGQVKTVGILVQYIIPIIVILFGLVIWLRRRFL